MNTRHQWQSTQERVDELTGKISVKKRDNESIFKKQQEAIEENEEKILSQRVVVKEARQKLAKMMNKDFEVIEEALKGKRFTQLQCKRYDVDTAKKELNEDVCVEHKRLNHYIHQKECRMRRLEDLRLQLRDFNLLHESNFEREDQKRVRLLMTKLDKMNTKRNTAKYVQSTYLKTLNKLNRDALTLHKHLDQFEVEVVGNQKELEDLTTIYKSAKSGQESARTNRLTLEQEVYHNKQIRDKTLSETRKRAKESAQMPDISTNRAPADILNVGTSKVKKTTGDRPSDRLAKIQPAIRIFGNVTNTVAAKDIPKAYKRQIENYEAMVEQSKKLNKQLEAKKAVVEEAEKKMVDIKYNQKEQTAELERETEALTSKLAELELAEVRNEEKINVQTDVLMRVMDSINSLTEKLTPARMQGVAQAPSTTSSSLADNNMLVQVGDIHTKLKVMVQKLKDKDLALIHRQTLLADKPNAEELTEEEVEDQIDELQISTEGKRRNGARIIIKDDDDEAAGDNFLMNEINVNEHYVNREDIKKPKLKNKKR